MKVPLSLLKEYIALPLPSSAIAEVLIAAGIEVDEIERVGSRFSGVVVGFVEETSPHPKADRLAVARVFDGKERVQVVCGAPNCRAGIYVAFARIGARLEDNLGKEWVIKKAKLRDVESFGMLCSADELHLGESDGKILELPSDLPLGKDIRELYEDEIFSLSLTPNLGHCLSIRGIARELSAHLNLPLIPRPFSSTGAKEKSPKQGRIVDLKQCSDYACSVVHDVQIAPSPSWLKRKVEACGMRSVNNAVDVGNLVMYELGQPLHFFDASKIAGDTLFVTSHTPYKYLRTLDGQNKEVPEEALLICDAEKPLAFAGIMGGESSSITENTKQVVIESAHFAPSSIRKTARILGMKTEASSRFEKGVDRGSVQEALVYATSLLIEVAGGKRVGEICFESATPLVLRKIRLRSERVNHLLGMQMSISEMALLLERLHMKVEEQGKELLVTIPSFRTDVQQEVDLIEEIARIYGYQNLPLSIPKQTFSLLANAPLYEFETFARRSLCAQGLQEWMTCDLISPVQAERSLIHGLGKEHLISVLCAASEEQSVLRTTLLPGMVRVAKYNLDRGNVDLAAFEVGRIHFREGEEYKEPTMAALLLSGKGAPYHFDPKPRELDFFDLKGIVENVLETFSLSSLSFEPSHLPQFHPGRQAKIVCNGIVLGVMGELHPSYLEKEEIEKRVLFAQVNLHEILPLYKKENKVITPPIFPGSQRDWTITVPLTFPIQQLFDSLTALRSPFLEKVFLLDLYKSSEIGEDKKNVTLRFLYRDKEKTLSFEEVEQEHARLVSAVVI